MVDVIDLSMAQILAIPALEPERLFGKPELMHDRFKALAKKWHPDNLSTGNDDVFKHVGILHDRAKHLADNDLWHIPGELTFSSGGKTYSLRYFKSFDFELGRVYLSQTRLTYVIAKENADLVENARRIISDLSFPDRETKEVMSRYLPTIIGVYETTDSVVMMLEKPADLIRMRDLLDHFEGKIDPKHVAWMVSRMLNHASYFEWAKISHNDLSLDSLFVCPEMHTVCVLGGWWYATKTGEKLKALPQRTVSNAPSDVIKNKQGAAGTDPELIRLTGRELLGNSNGIHLVSNKDIPEPMVTWLRVSGRGSAIKDYAQWREKTLMDSFGPRKFVKMLVTAKDVYQF